MKIRFGNVEKEVVRFSNEIYKNADMASERISVEMEDTSVTVQALDQEIEEGFRGTITLIDDGGNEETFAGYELESLRKSYDSMGKKMFVEFAKPESEEIA